MKLPNEQIDAIIFKAVPALKQDGDKRGTIGWMYYRSIAQAAFEAGIAYERNVRGKENR